MTLLSLTLCYLVSNRHYLNLRLGASFETLTEHLLMMTDAELALQELAAEIAKNHGYHPHELKMRPVTTNGANFTSGLFSLTISCKNKRDINGFAKVVMLGGELRECSQLAEIFNKESLFYTKLAKTYKELERKYEVPEENTLRLPQCYGLNTEKEILVLEDLTKSGFELLERRECYSWEYAKAAVTQMAKFHALSLTLREEFPEEYAKLSKNLEFQLRLDDTSRGSMPEMIMKGVFDLVKPENHKSLKRFVETRMTEEELLKLHKPIRRPVIIHGDYRVSNLMHKLHENGDYDVIPVDFQTILSGCPLVDLHYFIYSGSDAEFREKYMSKLVQHYYTQLCDHLTRLDQDPELLYSKEDFKYEMEKTKYYGLILSLIVLKIVTVQPEDVPTLDNNMNLGSFNVKPSDLYKKRLNEVIDEYIKSGLL